MVKKKTTKKVVKKEDPLDYGNLYLSLSEVIDFLHIHYNIQLAKAEMATANQSLKSLNLEIMYQKESIKKYKGDPKNESFIMQRLGYLIIEVDLEKEINQKKTNVYKNYQEKYSKFIERVKADRKIPEDKEVLGFDDKTGKIIFK